MTPITTIGMVTADRPAAVRRGLESLVRCCDTYSRRPRCLVIDGSRKPTNRAATHAVVLAVAAATGRDLQYIGAAAAARLAGALAGTGEGPPRLAPGTAGENRNLLLLLTAGEHVLAIDDDVVCDTWAPAEQNPTLAVMGHRQELIETDFFPDRAAARRAVGRTRLDLLASHEALLGHSLDALIAASGGQVDLTHGCAHIRVALIEARPLTVKVTFAGVAGDAGTYCPSRLLFDAGPVRARLWASQAAFAIAMTSREVRRIARGPVVTHDCGCMATCMGVSNQSIVPPFMPAQGNEDGVFGAMLAACDASALFGHLSCGVVHDSHRPSRRADPPFLSATQSRLSDVILLLLPRLSAPASAVPAAASPGAWMEVVGRGLMASGTSNLRTFVDLVRALILEAHERELARADRAAERPECPDHWRAALARYRDHVARSAARREFFLPIEYHGFGSIEAGYRALQAFLVRFGQLVASWPVLWERARALNPHAGCAVDQHDGSRPARVEPMG